MNNARGRSYEAGVAPHDPGSIGPGRCGFPRTPISGSSVNKGKVIIPLLVDSLKGDLQLEGGFARKRM